MPDEQPQLAFGTTVYTEDGTEIGRIRGVDEDGLYVTLREGFEGLSVEHVRSGHEFGEAELMWRCWECGEMGRLDSDLPDTCPACGAGREDLYYWTED
ncbi:hydrogenase maturation nickel metallochaperone HypA [Natrinema caseinilyticum]|uniref:hydrogenase maturation nickel metallochaperone HypA n=1 Tax=Natrinema caseinilyticum TaxID=2961570 RepID=UPI0020C263FA|nr:hydrogenase maturation nickel metallochaperone HypA [Natrinema caseinilyticum]